MKNDEKLVIYGILSVGVIISSYYILDIFGIWRIMGF